MENTLNISVTEVWPLRLKKRLRCGIKIIQALEQEASRAKTATTDSYLRCLLQNCEENSAGMNQSTSSASTEDALSNITGENNIQELVAVCVLLTIQY